MLLFGKYIMQQIYNIKLDTKNLYTKPTSVVLTADDTDVHQFNFAITEKGILKDLSDVGLVTIIFKRTENGTIVEDLATIDYTNNVITYGVSQTVIKTAGQILGQIQMYGEGNVRLSTAPFIFSVIDDIDDIDTITEDSQYPILTQLITDFLAATYSEAEQKTYEQMRKESEIIREANEDIRLVNEANRIEEFNSKIVGFN